MSRIYISAAHKSSGKTTLSIGLCRALYQRGLVVQPFKKGPDYIDPLWLAQASGLTHTVNSDQGCYNLDFNTMNNNEILRTLVHNSRPADMSIIEGNKGLYDGVALDGSDSNAALASLTKTPVILVIDTRGVTRGVAPLLLGYQAFEENINIAGVIFNLSSGGRHEDKLRAVTDAYTDIPVLGVVPKSPKLELDERHLGLMPSNERMGAQQKVDEIAELVASHVDLEKVLDVAKCAPPLVEISHIVSRIDRPERADDTLQGAEKLRIGICEDSSFGFYYTDDKQALKAAGAELVSINTLEDAGLPDLDGLFIGGGFPETHMQQLEKNRSMRESIRQAIEAGLPTYAECGGLMYLSQNLHWNGQSVPMVGIIPADVSMHKKPQGRGHVKLMETPDMPWPGTSDSKIINAHEFHYSCLENLDEEFLIKGKFAYQVKRGTGITGEQDGWVYKNLMASYAHLRDTENYHWVRRFLDFVRDIKSKKTAAYPHK